jgi:class 3 adenylate cyclase
LVYESGDFYGRTVNTAARIAAHSSAGQVLVSAEVASHGASAGVRFTRLGPVAFKGVSEDVVLYEASRT